jgi:hypothetical protein
MSKRTQWLTHLSSTSLLAFAIACWQTPAKHAGGQTKQDHAEQLKTATTAWSNVPVGDGRIQTRDLGNATVTLPGTPKASLLDIPISSERHVLFDGLKYKGFILLCISHTLEGDPPTLRRYEDSLANALVEHFRGMYSNLSSERESNANTSSIEFVVGTNRVGVFTFKSNGRSLVVFGAVSVSPGIKSNDAVERSFFESFRFKETSSMLTLARTTGDLLVFSDTSRTSFFIVPRLQFDNALPILLDFQSRKDFIRFEASLVWPDALGAPRDALRDEFQKSGQTASLFRHDLEDVTVSLEVDNVIVHVWNNPSLKEDVELAFRVDQPQYEALQRLAGSSAVRDSARLIMRAKLIENGALIQFTETAFPQGVSLEIDK